MVQAVTNIDENTNRVLNIVKAKFGLKDKSQPINVVVNEYEENFLEPKLRPEYKDKLQKIVKSKHISRRELDAVL
jgi:hypothetical protein